jgi:hypothetical protein
VPQLTEPPVLDEAHAHHRLDALIAEHNLPIVYAHWEEYEPDFLALVRCDPFVLHVRVPARGDVATWAALLGGRAKAEHRISDHGDQWCVTWTQAVRVAWLPGVLISVTHSEQRWVGPEARS